MRYFLKYSILAISLVSLNFCINTPENNLFYVNHKGSKMPVWVKGNVASNTFILVVHGGPGDTGTAYDYMTPFPGFQTDYAIVYWDQRNSGFSQGNPDLSTLTVAQFVEDMQVVIEVLKSQYTVNSLFIMGHSWGGILGSAYLTSSSKDSLIKGWIDVDGGIGWQSNYAYSRTWIQARIPELLAGTTLDSDTRKTLEEGLAWYTENPFIYYTNDTIQTFTDRLLQHARYVTTAGGYEYTKGIIQKFIASIPIFDPAAPADWLADLSIRPSLNYNWFDTPENINALMNDVNLALINVPCLYLWGRHDGILPVELGQYQFSQLTSVPAADKSMVIFESSGHTPMLEEGDQFYTEVKSFVDKYK